MNIQEAVKILRDDENAEYAYRQSVPKFHLSVGLDDNVYIKYGSTVCHLDVADLILDEWVIKYKVKIHKGSEIKIPGPYDNSNPITITPQFPGMIEVEYLKGYKNVVHYSNLKLIHEEDGYFVFDKTELALYNLLDRKILDERFFGIMWVHARVTEQEYNRILDLFKQSGLEVKGCD